MAQLAHKQQRVLIRFIWVFIVLRIYNFGQAVAPSNFMVLMEGGNDTSSGEIWSLSAFVLFAVS